MKLHIVKHACFNHQAHIARLCTERALHEFYCLISKGFSKAASPTAKLKCLHQGVIDCTRTKRIKIKVIANRMEIVQFSI